MIDNHTYVELTRKIDGFPQASRGTIIDVFTKPVGYVVEMNNGQLLDCFEDDLKVIEI